MKKTSYILSICFAIIYGCSENQPHLSTQWDENKIIQFRSMRNKMITRIANDNEENYGVYSYIDGDSNWYMENLTVTSKDSITTGGTYYWPTYDSLNFFAYCPNSYTGIDSVIVSINPLSINLYYQHLGDGTDFTIATPVKQARSPSTNNVSVPLVFKHMLSKVDITVNLSSELIANKYQLNEGSAGVVVDENDTVYWSNITVPYNNGVIDAASDNPTWTIIGNSSIEFVSNTTFLLIPQTYNEENDTCTIQLQNIIIKRNNEVVFHDDLKPYKLKAGDIDLSTFMMGKHYLFLFTIDATSEDLDGNPIFGEEISFSSSIVNEGDNTDVNETQP